MRLVVASAIAYWLAVRQSRPLTAEPARPPAFVLSTNQEAHQLGTHSGNVLLHSGNAFQAIETFLNGQLRKTLFSPRLMLD